VAQAILCTAPAEASSPATAFNQQLCTGVAAIPGIARISQPRRHCRSHHYVTPGSAVAAGAFGAPELHLCPGTDSHLQGFEALLHANSMLTPSAAPTQLIASLLRRRLSADPTTLVSRRHLACGTWYSSMRVPSGIESCQQQAVPVITSPLAVLRQAAYRCGAAAGQHTPQSYQLLGQRVSSKPSAM
jgi:hypothetical protein